MACVLSALRTNKEVLKQNLTIFLEDPTIDWIIDSKAQKAHGMQAGEEEDSRPAQSKKLEQGHGFLRDRMAVLECKLRGRHPCHVMKMDVKSNQLNQHIVENQTYINALLDRIAAPSAVRGAGGRASAFATEECLSAGDQVPPAAQLLQHTHT